MKKQVLCLMFLVLFALVTLPVHAQTIQIANPDSLSQQDIMVYYYNGTLYGRYNTTSAITLNSNLDYVFTLKPQYSNPLDNPVGWLQSSFSYVSTYATPLIIIIFLIGLLYLGRR
jgi:hypothetical protein